ncbi:hypothetical protein T069G_01713 [Trichoderma breve]|uniref:Uncharacterized protein n=1 Tax=Trichoderma breve TaxID=2034170 RepID=A0A9W9JRY2_9HYPO|nr:hypothetical protein T069G_01713 [Trichoderma breve]KAJ4865183.1 hypothetical protein T069G_01713 [Trichoderma breve]
MRRFRVPEKDSTHCSRDSLFRRSFYQPLQKNPPRLTKEGYIRALQLYGREDHLLDSLKSSVARFNEWRKDNPGDLAEYRRYATERGYDWENGTVDINSYYTSYIESTEVSQGNLTTPQTAATRPIDSPPNQPPWVEFAQPDEASSSGEDQMTPRNPEGRFITMKRQQAATPAARGTGARGRGRVTRSQATPSRPASSSTGRNRRQAIVVEDQERPYLLQGAVGNMVWKEGEAEANASGVSYIATAAMNALRHIVRNGGTIEGRDLELAQELVEYINEDNMEQFRIQLGNVVQGETPSGGLRNSWLEEEEEVAPLPVQRRLFGEASTPSRKRPSSLLQELQADDESDTEDAGRVQGNAREQSEMPYILEDCWEVAGEKIHVSVLYANGQALPLRDTNVAKLLGKFHEAVIKEGKINVTLAKSMGMLGIPAVLRMDPAAIYLTGEGAVKALDASSTCSKLAQRSAVRK